MKRFMKQGREMQMDHAEEIALASLGWLLDEDDLVGVFVAATGATPDDLRGQLSADAGPDQTFLLVVLDFIMMRDATVIDCARAQGIRPETLAQAHAVLSGAAQHHWT